MHRTEWLTALRPFLVSPAVADKNWMPGFDHDAGFRFGAERLLNQRRGHDGGRGDGWRIAFDQPSTPVLTLDVDALEHNVHTMQQWMDDRGLRFAPHGKTTMTPALWSWQLAAGAWGITVANESQLRVARGFDVRRVVIANEFISPRGLAWLARELERDAAFDVVCWVDSLDGVAQMTRHLQDTGAARPLTVCIEVGAEGARGGARTLELVRELARAVVDSDALQLRGIAGYEGNVPGQDDAKVRGIRAYLDQLSDAFTTVLPLVETDRPMLTAGGSAYFDLVAEAFAPVVQRHPDADVVLRSGAYIIHDDGLYRRSTPAATRTGPQFKAAAHVWARVISVPEPGLALLDAGKRDLAYDSGLPEVQQVLRDTGGGPQPVPADALPTDGLMIAKINDQHAYVVTDALRVGDLVRLGLSHPCTIFDKWRTALLLEQGERPVIRGAIATYF